MCLWIEGLKSTLGSDTENTGFFWVISHKDLFSYVKGDSTPFTTLRGSCLFFFFVDINQGINYHSRESDLDGTLDTDTQVSRSKVKVTTVFDILNPVYEGKEIQSQTPPQHPSIY